MPFREASAPGAAQLQALMSCAHLTNVSHLGVGASSRFERSAPLGATAGTCDIARLEAMASNLLAMDGLQKQLKL